MKYIIITVIVLGLILGGITLKNQKVTVENHVPKIVEKEKVVEKIEDALTKRIEDAQNASSTEIEASAQKAYEDKKSLMLDEIEIRVRKEYEAELEAQRIELEKKVGSY